ncbi:RICIN domain-containing protein [Actinosynnema sp. NPDC004786]
MFVFSRRSRGRSRLLPIVLSVLLGLPVAAVAAAPAAHASPPTALRTGSGVVMAGLHSGFVWDVGGGGGQGAEVVSYPFVGYANQFFVWEESRRRPGYFSVRAAHSNLCVDVEWGNTAPGTPVWSWPCYDGDPQLWRIDTTGNGGFRLVGLGGLCLTVPSVKGRPLFMDHCGARDEQWMTYSAPLVQPAPISDPPTTKVLTMVYSFESVMTRYGASEHEDFLVRPVVDSAGRVGHLLYAPGKRLCLGSAGYSHSPVGGYPCDPGTTRDAYLLWFREQVGTSWLGTPEYLYRYGADPRLCLTGGGYLAQYEDRVEVYPCYPTYANQRWR